ncbi:hypothetical protein LJE86_05275 [bacterium BMS3Abin03]|jgi:hypothetical protein|nr:hypothetical protein [bacterium BMS3Abin03]MCG6958971.1 hypothetical protein [bacterium BMS3Abin03]
MKKILATTIIIVATVIIVAGDLFAIPAFARKYNMSCKTCHSPIPYLKPYGNEFAANGFVLKDKDAPRYFVQTGDDRLSLIRDFPLAVRIQGYVTYNEENEEQFDIGTPSAFKIMSGGSITKDVSYYAYYILESGEPGKIEDAWLMFNNMFGSELDLTVGQFQVSDPIFKRELRLTNEDYIIYKVRPGNSMIDLTYDRGVTFAYTLPTSTDLVLEVVNGSGIGELYSNNLFDRDKYKNLMGRVSQAVSENLRVGAMGYYGNEMVDQPDTSLSFKNGIWMIGGDATLESKLFELNVQYVYRNDDNPYAMQIGKEVKTQGGFAELIFRPDGDESIWYMVALYNHVDSDDNALDYKSIAGHIGYLLRRNIRLVGECVYDIDNEYAKFNVGFVTAF